MNQWPQRGFLLPDGSVIVRMVTGGPDWQIHAVSGDGRCLIVTDELHRRWTDGGIIDSGCFGRLETGTAPAWWLANRGRYLISSIRQGPYPDTASEAYGFALALKQMRLTRPGIALGDGLYIEQYSRILPTYSSASDNDDKLILGAWLTGGVNISIDSFDRLCTLTGWMPASEVKRVLAAAGLEPGNGEYRTELRTDEGLRESSAAVTAVRKAPIPQERFRLPGRKHLEKFFNEQIIDIIRHEESYRIMGIHFPSAILLHGEPGSGKTYAVEKLIEYLGLPHYSIDSSTIGSTYIHETSKKIADIFTVAIANAPSVIVMDEMEAFLTSRDQPSSGVHHVEEVAEFLRRIPEAIEHKVLLIAMTNKLDMIDSAILRRGRFDHVIKVEMPSREEVQDMLSHSFGKLPLSGDVDLSVLAGSLAGRPLSDAAFLVREAGRHAVRMGKTVIDDDCIEQARSCLSDPAGKPGRIGF